MEQQRQSILDYATTTNIVDREKTLESAREVLNIASEAVANTYGPNGSHSLYTDIPRGKAEFTKDGISVLERISFRGAMENSLFQYFLQTSRKVNQIVGDGTTTAFIATSKIFNRIYDLISNGKLNARPHDISIALRGVTKLVQDKLMESANKLPVDNNELLDTLGRIATISLNNDKPLADVLIEAYRAVGVDGNIIVQSSPDEEFKIVPSVGYRLDYGYYSASMINDGEDNAVKLQNSDILIFEGTPNNLEHEEMIKLLINEYREQGKPLTIILGGMSVRLATYLSVVLHHSNRLNANTINIVEIPIGTKNQKERVADLGIVLNAKPINVATNILPGFEELPTEEYFNKPIKDKASEALQFMKDNKYFGKSDVMSYSDYTIFENPQGAGSDLHVARINETTVELNRKLKLPSTGELEIAQLREHLSFLTNKTLRLYVGGETDTIKKARIDLFDDAIRAIKATSKFGYSKGCNLDIILALNDSILELQGIIEKETKQSQIDLYQKSILLLTATRDAFIDLYKLLISKFYDDATVNKLITKSVEDRKPFDLITGSFNDTVINPTLTDIVVVETAIGVVADLVVANQFVLSTLEDNIYMSK